MIYKVRSMYCPLFFNAVSNLRREMKTETIVVLLFLLNWAYSDEECPTNFDYVRQLPWNKSFCESAIIKPECCLNLVSLFGIGVAQYLRDSSIFMFPTYASAVACLDLFQ